MTAKELIKIFRKNGWIQDRISGSHHIMVKEGCRSVPIPVHGKKELHKGFVKRILKQANIRLED